MEKIEIPIIPEKPQLFNSALETGTRLTIILDAAYPRAFDVSKLIWFDHMIVHSADAGGPPSLHPAISERTGELLVRRRLVEESLTLMRRMHLVDAIADENGLSFQASEDAAAFVALMKSEYSIGLKTRAQWLIETFADLDGSKFSARVTTDIEQWAAGFGPTATRMNHDR